MALQLSALESKPLKQLKEQIMSDSGRECEGQWPDQLTTCILPATNSARIYLSCPF